MRDRNSWVLAVMIPDTESALTYLKRNRSFVNCWGMIRFQQGPHGVTCLLLITIVHVSPKF